MSQNYKSKIYNHHNKIVFRLLRRPEAGQPDSPDRDDYIILKHKGEDVYQIWYRDANYRNKKRHQLTVLSGEEVDQYLRSLFVLLRSDRDGFAAVQVEIPCFPPILLATRDLCNKTIRNTLKKIMPILCVATAPHIDSHEI